MAPKNKYVVFADNHDGKCPFGADSLSRIKELKKLHKLDLDSGVSHRLFVARAGHATKGKERRK